MKCIDAISMLMLIFILYSFDYAQAVDTHDGYLKFIEGIISEDESYYNDYRYSVNEKEEKNRNNKEGFEKETKRSKSFTTENEQIQTLRKESFARELAHTKEDMAASQKILQQKKQDAKTVHRIFRAFQSNDYYAVLGIRNFVFSNLRIPTRTIKVIPKYVVVRIPGFELFTISEKQIKRAYREMAKLVHPDKSKDPRAVEAFLLVEDVAAILLNDVTRSEYNALIQKERREHRKRIVDQVIQGIEKSLLISNTVLHSAKRLVGSFCIPVVMLVALIA